ncbi:MAG: sulfurtransferase [Sandaracinaceae bacterium]
MGTILAPDALRTDMVLLDARMAADARARFRAGHLEGARFVDVEHDLSGDASDPSHGGRHPLPAIEAWTRTLGRLGVTPDRTVVVYDEDDGAKAAARAWWMLRAVGHDDAYVLDGGLRAATAAGWPVVSGEGPADADAPPYPADRWTLPMAVYEEIEAARRDPTRAVLDVRGRERYVGAVEPFEPVAGHIAGAINLPLAENLDAQGRFLDADALRAKYEPLLGGRAPDRLIVSCGSGITACHTLLALERAGLTGAALYVGSFSEWSRRGGEIGTGEEP